MKKRTDIQIYELVYSKCDFGLWDNELYTPLQCGASYTKTNVCEQKDNDGDDNISEMNFYYSETTGTYWIWKNAPRTKYIGQCQYRRRLQFDTDFDFDSVLDGKHTIIVNRPICIARTLLRQLEVCHPQISNDLITESIKETSPRYLQYYDVVMKNGHNLFFSSSYVMRWEYFDDYCSFLFPVLQTYAEKTNSFDREYLRTYVTGVYNMNLSVLGKKPISYHMLLGGFIQERLFTVWLLANFKKEEIVIKDFKFMDKSIAF